VCVVCYCLCVSVCVQVQNEDGLWVRLTAESIREFCRPLNGFTEGWALQFNQHIAKTLLVPVTDRATASGDHRDILSDRRPPPPAPPPRQNLAAAARNGL